MPHVIFFFALLFLAISAGALGFVFGLAEGVEAERKRIQKT